MSPDDGGYERVKLMAAKLGIPAYYIDKKRIAQYGIGVEDRPN